MGGKRVKLQIWDTAGQERFRAVTRSYYRGAAGAIIVYDISNRDSFSHVQQWLNDAQQLAGEHICMMVVGNKADLQGEREVTFLEASRVAQEAEVLFLETSALTGEGVEDIFMRVARGIHARAFQLPPSLFFSFSSLLLLLSTLRRHGQRLTRSNESVQRNSVLCCARWWLRFDIDSCFPWFYGLLTLFIS
jgi:small GTP-binding protein